MPRPSNNIHKKIFLSIFLVIVGILILSQTFKRALFRITSDFYHPFLDLPVQVENSISDNSLMLESKTKLVSVVNSLRRENERLTAVQAVYTNLRQENNELRKLINLAEKSKYKCSFAEIIIRDPAFWDKKFTINKGTKDNIKIGSLVLSYSNIKKQNKYRMTVIGRITSTSEHSAIVSTIFSEECRLSVILPHSKAHGIIKGGIRTEDRLLAKVDFLPRDLKYYADEPVRVEFSVIRLSRPFFSEGSVDWH